MFLYFPEHKSSKQGGVVAHETEAGWSLYIQVQPCLHSKFWFSQGYIVRPLSQKENVVCQHMHVVYNKIYIYLK